MGLLRVNNAARRRIVRETTLAVAQENPRGAIEIRESTFLHFFSSPRDGKYTLAEVRANILLGHTRDAIDRFSRNWRLSIFNFVV